MSCLGLQRRSSSVTSLREQGLVLTTAKKNKLAVLHDSSCIWGSIDCGYVLVPWTVCVLRGLTRD